MKCYLLATVILIVSPSIFDVYSLGTDFVSEFSSYPLYHFRQTPSALEPHPPKTPNAWQKKISTSLHRKTTILLAKRKQLSSINSSSHQKHRHGSLGPSQISHLNPTPRSLLFRSILYLYPALSCYTLIAATTGAEASLTLHWNHAGISNCFRYMSLPAHKYHTKEVLYYTHFINGVLKS